MRDHLYDMYLPRDDLVALGERSCLSPAITCRWPEGRVAARTAAPLGLLPFGHPLSVLSKVRKKDALEAASSLGGAFSRWTKGFILSNAKDDKARLAEPKRALK